LTTEKVQDVSVDKFRKDDKLRKKTPSGQKALLKK
jgi:hypothetical protein